VRTDQLERRQTDPPAAVTQQVDAFPARQVQEGRIDGGAFRHVATRFSIQNIVNKTGTRHKRLAVVLATKCHRKRLQLPSGTISNKLGARTQEGESMRSLTLAWPLA
jgi:hypothetical protein